MKKWQLNKKFMEYLLSKHGAKTIKDATGYSRQIIHAWTSGKHTPSVKAVISLCNALGYNPGSFFDLSSTGRNTPPEREEGEQNLTPGKQYMFCVGQSKFSITPVNSDTIKITVYEQDESLSGFRTLKEKEVVTISLTDKNGSKQNKR